MRLTRASILTLATLLVAAAAEAQSPGDPPRYDIVVRGGRVLDGAGNRRQRESIG